MKNVALASTDRERGRAGDVFIVLGALGLFGGLLSEQALVMLAGVVLFVIGVAMVAAKLHRSWATRWSESVARIRANAEAANAKRRGPVAVRLLLGLAVGIAASRVASSIWG
jgi:uncharacterized membrane protein HdeD (DUF308 family)